MQAEEPVCGKLLTTVTSPNFQGIRYGRELPNLYGRSAA